MPSQAWFEPKIAHTTQALEAGDGCHPDEAKALSDYLNGTIDSPEAAREFTAPVLSDANPPQQLYRIWALLSESLVELTAEERHKTLDLMSAVQALPPSSGVDWSDLTGFASMWDTLYRLHLHGPDGWEKDVDSFSEEKMRDFRKDYDAVGTAEAEMFVQGIDAVVHENWGFKVLNLVCSERKGLDIFLSEIYAWLRFAGAELKKKVNWVQTDGNSPSPEWRSDGKTTAVHWETWKREMLKLSKDDNKLSEEGRKLAAECYKLM
ncbi:hypothetical protein Slin15195_G073870 [Septoria linicola]|uniref:Uncharacterized protein n=1 Tax=Septoria linicola TaxID=215465 RepID=A0A9Q9AVQ2_9PEZI|nr:hypothetical protein Slin15195_G073870 [Septoria linicola]